MNEGDDPVALKRTAKLGALSFRAAARAAHEELAPSIKNPKDRAAFLRSLERHVFPRLGDEPVGAITPAQLRQTNYPRELCEAALSHKVGDQVERAYARSDLFEKRRVMMEEWARPTTSGPWPGATWGWSPSPASRILPTIACLLWPPDRD